MNSLSANPGTFNRRRSPKWLQTRKSIERKRPPDKALKSTPRNPIKSGLLLPRCVVGWQAKRGFHSKKLRFGIRYRGRLGLAPFRTAIYKDRERALLLAATCGWIGTNP